MRATAFATSARPETSSSSLRSSPQLASVIEFESARWLASLLLDLRSLEQTGQNIAGIGDFTVSTSTANSVRRLLTLVFDLPIPDLRLSPFSGGGVALISNLDNKELILSVYPGQPDDFVFSLTNDEDENLSRFGTIPLDQPSQLHEVVKAFLS
jgi:hypothetical protein